MPRTYAKLLVSIWNDPEWRELDADAQRLYLFLISQPDLSHCGAIPMRIRRWAGYSANTSLSEIGASLVKLRDARFVLIDPDTEEAFIRSFMRHDGATVNKNLCKAMASAIEHIESPTLQYAAKCELAKAVGDPLPDPPPTALEAPPDTPTDTPPQPPTGGDGQPTAPHLHLSPDTKTLRLVSEIEAQPSSANGSPPTASVIDRDFQRWWANYPRKVGKKAAMRAYRAARREVGADRLTVALEQYRTQVRGVENRFIAHPATWLNAGRWDDEAPTNPEPRVINGAVMSEHYR